MVRQISRRAVLRLLGGVSVLTALSACSPPSPTPTPAPPAEAPKPAAQPTPTPAAAAPVSAPPARIKFQSRGGDAILKVTQTLVAEFKKAFSRIEVEIDHTTGDHFQKVQLGVAAGNPPDVYFDASLRTGGLGWKKGIIEDLEPYLRRDFNPDEHIKEMWIAMVYDGRRIAVPFDSGAMALFFNIDLFNQAGLPLPDPKKRLTWDELLQLATKLTLDVNGKHPGEPGFDPTRIKQYGFAPTLLHGHEHWIYTLGGEIINKEGKVTVASPEAIEGYQKLADWGVKHFVGPSPEYKQANPVGFAAGNVAMSEEGVWMLGRTNDAKINWGVAPFPMQKIPVSYGHYSGQSMTRMSRAKDAAWQWMKWVSLDKEGQTILFKGGLLQPTRKDLIEAFINDSQPPAKQYREVFYNELDPNTIRWPGQHQNSFYLGYRQYWIDAWNPRYDPVLRGKKSYREIAQEVQEILQRIVDTGEPATQ